MGGRVMGLGGHLRDDHRLERIANPRSGSGARYPRRHPHIGLCTRCKPLQASGVSRFSFAPISLSPIQAAASRVDTVIHMPI